MDPQKISKSIGFCSQDDLALTENTIYENLAFLAAVKGVPKSNIKSEVERVINKLDLTLYTDTIVSKLHQEQRKKLSIAIALLNDPQIIVMDEPTSGTLIIFEQNFEICIGLDPLLRKSLQKIIKDLKKDNKTIVLTTQFLDDAEELADRLSILSKGKKSAFFFRFKNLFREIIRCRERRLCEKEIWGWIYTCHL